MRRRRAEIRKSKPDSKYKSELVGKFISVCMLKGKRSKSERIVYKSFDIACEKLGQKDAIEVFTKCVDNIRPLLELKPRRVGGATYQIPIEVKRSRGVEITLRWIRDFARAKKGKPMHEKLAEELIAAFKGEGAAVKKRDDTHRMAEANKAFAHFRW